LNIQIFSNQFLKIFIKNIRNSTKFAKKSGKFQEVIC